ncbi:MAG TPA: uracil-DNA glycosylase family protein [Ohtaekwangia sp.]
MFFDSNILQFYKSLQLKVRLPEGVSFMNPYQDKQAFALAEKFYKKFYGDEGERTLILGINPGRFGGGVTGIPFTDPIRLASDCGIENPLAKKPELSSEYIYRMITAYGGPEKFYQRFFISAVSPLGFTKDGKNLNYYDIKELQRAVEPFMIKSIRAQLDFRINRERCYCLGEGKNFEYLTYLNTKESFFKEIIPLAHPRFIMQYKRRFIDQYIEDYLSKFKAESSKQKI